MSEKDWFEDQWFWEDYRSILFPKERLQRTEEQVDRFEELLNLDKDDKILDLACGIGRHAFELAERGYEVTGLDLSETYMKEASSKVKNDDLEFVQGDMREFVKEGYYDVIINFWSSFGYFEDEMDNEKVVNNVYDSLKSDGRFLLDVMGKEIMDRLYTERDWARIDDGFFLEERFLKDNGDYLESNWILIKNGKIKENKFLYRRYSKSEIKGLLKKAGFSNVDIYGDLYCSEYNRNADRLVALAWK